MKNSKPLGKEVKYVLTAYYRRERDNKERLSQTRKSSTDSCLSFGGWQIGAIDY
jgi:hypothetical protein